ncbi:bifunctional serine/threonine-protein kinase/formylglycine-generating enzyme family protein [Kamptonema sp. UHCC 0994]|uniref:bifunctional serine/threonine-protein kinase/formylglycine-generating enzyme family protein n=1 Tax=Kamptonema sp. UHCC 0994 TaxID=3031329 RepID=UPI0023BA1590|nr:bifunctional serine/threonine-protein kinase/formylglycine-generating enzyme family protein [Kamptonema sp. UHCC 0994]MDF0555996.1 bifunctional serine/threonine-protein kinase/formylglycine-generating enzyme family protein [Kamptonema sp. UHCC 0994]
MLGQKLRDRYHILKMLGQGGFGVTYLAKDYDLPGHPQCVVKHLKPKSSDPAVLDIARRLFDTEAQILYRLGKLHDRIPTLSAHFEENGEFYFVQDFIDGHDLTKELLPGEKLSESYVISLLQNILDILAVVHQQNVIHRDIKPANLMRCKDGKIALIDFGAVKEISALAINSQGQTSFTIMIGSPGYMPSEQAKGKPKFSSDIYAVGMVGIQALTGQNPKTLPEDQMTGEVIWRDRVQVSQNLANILDKMVRDHFSQRYQNAEEILEAILDLSLNASLDSDSTISVTIQQKSPSPPAIVLKTNASIDNFSTISITPQQKSPSLPAIVSKTFDFETVTVNSTGQITNRRQKQGKFFTENTGNDITIEMISIPGGSFVMVSPDTKAEGLDIEGPEHNVTVASFFMGKYEVTQEQYQAVMGNNPSRFKGAKRPVEKVSWYDAIAFCQKLSQKTGKSYRLPSEAEWEYACRAGTKTPFYFGETITPELVNYNGTYSYGAAPKGLYRQQTTDVGSFPPNAFGLYDMHGNVWEWCADPWHDNYQGAPQDDRVWDETHNDNRYQDYDLLVNIKDDNRTRLLRGGSWFNDPAFCRAAIRFSVVAPDYRSSSFGFRLVCAIA